MSIRIPGAVRVRAGGLKTFTVEVTTVGEALQALVKASPRPHTQLEAPNGDLRRHINVFAGDEDIRSLEHLVKDGETLIINPAISGG